MTAKDTGSPKQGRTCIFCGRAPVTKEHVLAKWVSAELASSTGPDFVGFRAEGGLGRFGQERPIPSREVPIIDQTSRRYCKGCNNGWMSRLEEDVKPLLAPMMRGEQVELAPTAQETIARWAAKTAIVVQQLDPPPDGARLDFGWLQSGVTPQSGLWVALAAYVGQREGTGHSIQAFRASERFSGELLNLRLGRLAVLTFIWAGMTRLRLQTSSEVHRFVVQVWPSSRLTRVWPPTARVDDEGLAVLADGIDKGLFRLDSESDGAEHL